MNEVMLEEIMDQPSALRISLPVLRENMLNSSVVASTFKRIIFCGSGDSFFSAESLAFAARNYCQKDVVVLPSQEALSYWNYNSSDLFIPISISGETKRTVLAAIKAKQEDAYILSITSNPNSALAKASDDVLVIPFKSRTRKTPHTTDYVTTLLSIAVIIEKLHGEPIAFLDRLPDLVKQTIDANYHRSIEIAKTIADKRNYYFFGVGPSFGTCLYGAAKFWEARGICAFPFELDEVGHGLHMVLEKKDVIFVPVTKGKTSTRISKALKGFDLLNTHCIVISDEPQLFSNWEVMIIPDISEEWSPFLTCLPLQQICWAISNAKDYDVTAGGRFASGEAYDSVLGYLRGE